MTAIQPIIIPYLTIFSIGNIKIRIIMGREAGVSTKVNGSVEGKAITEEATGDRIEYSWERY